MRDFDISPSLLSKNQVVELWNRLVLYDEEPSDADSLLPSPQADLGMCLSLRKFLVIIFVAAVKGYEGDESLGDSACSEKVLVLFERMELAKGFQELSVKSRNITLLPSQEVIHQVLYPESDDVEEFSRISEETEEAAESVHEKTTMELLSAPKHSPSSIKLSIKSSICSRLTVLSVTSQNYKDELFQAFRNFRKYIEE